MSAHAKPLEEVPHAELDGDGRGVWHNDDELRKVTRPMTATEIEDYYTYDRSLARMREASLTRLRALHGDAWMLDPKPELRFQGVCR